VKTISGLVTVGFVLYIAFSIFGNNASSVVAVVAILYGLVSLLVSLFQYIRKALTGSVKIRSQDAEVEVSDFSHEELKRVINGLDIKEDRKSDAASGSGNGRRP
jgi:Mg2+/Co2+ transporter CorB